MIKTNPSRGPLLGSEFLGALWTHRVPIGRFSRHVDINPKTTANRWGKYPDRWEDPAPRWVDWVLMNYALFPELRESEERLPLPFSKWGISEERDELTGTQLKRILESYGVSPECFTAQSGRHPMRVADLLESQEDIPLWIEWMLLLYERRPETRTMTDRFDFPLAAWRDAYKSRQQTVGSKRQRSRQADR